MRFHNFATGSASDMSSSRGQGPGQGAGQRESAPVKGRFSFVSLGCPKNTVDSERMLGLLATDGYRLVPEGAEADFVIVNTCGFIDSARRESFDVIREMIARKEAGHIKGVVVAGCLAERQREAVLEEVPGVDQIIGVFGREEIAKAADRILGGAHEQRSLFRPAPVKAFSDRARLRITPRHYAYLKVSEGCDRLCTFCAIPGMRGKHLTKPVEEVVAEARELAADGVRELVLVAQDMTYYGLDLYGEPRLAQLLRRLDDEVDVDWIRILYNYPMHFTDELVDTLANASKILPYLDMPLQHINDRVLRAMNRRHTRAGTEAILRKLRDAIPELVLRTTFIVGFPGETDAEFEELLQFAKDWRFERMGAFPYSIEPGTPAARMKGHLPESVKEERRDRLMRAQQDIAFEINAAFVGRELDVLVDGTGDDGTLVGRSRADAPEVDGLVRLEERPGLNLKPGDLVECRVEAALGYDLLARPTGRPPRRRRSRPAGRRKSAFPSLPVLP